MNTDLGCPTIGNLMRQGTIPVPLNLHRGGQEVANEDHWNQNSDPRLRSLLKRVPQFGGGIIEIFMVNTRESWHYCVNN